MLIWQILPYLTPTLLPASLDTNSCCLTDPPPAPLPPPIHQLAHWLQPILTWPQQRWQCHPTWTHSFLEEDIQLIEAVYLGEYVCCHVPTIYEMRQKRLTIESQKKTEKYLALSIWGGAWRLSNPEIRHPPPAFLLLLLQTSRPPSFPECPRNRREYIKSQNIKNFSTFFGIYLAPAAKNLI